MRDMCRTYMHVLHMSSSPALRVEEEAVLGLAAKRSARNSSNAVVSVYLREINHFREASHEHGSHPYNECQASRSVFRRDRYGASAAILCRWPGFQNEALVDSRQG